MRSSSVERRLDNHQRYRGLREVGYVLALYFLYLSTKIRSTRASEEALENARKLVEWERNAGWLVEEAIQDFVIGSPQVAIIVNLLYALPHFLAVLGFLWWAYRYRPGSYPLYRNIFHLRPY